MCVEWLAMLTDEGGLCCLCMYLCIYFAFNKIGVYRVTLEMLWGTFNKTTSADVCSPCTSEKLR